MKPLFGILMVMALQQGHCAFAVVPVSGAVIGWGDNLSGQATGTPISSSRSNIAGVVTIKGQPLDDVVGIAAGTSHSLAIRRGGAVVAWGGNETGRGNVPSQLEAVVGISAGNAQSLAFKSDGTTASWGTNWPPLPAIPADLGKVISISAGWNFHLVLKADGSVIRWDGRDNPIIDGLSNAVAVVVGNGRYPPSLALKADGSVVAWGVNQQNLPVPPEVRNIVAVAAGSKSCLALDKKGKVFEWLYGSSHATNVMDGVVAISAGGMHSLALKSNGMVVAWGDNRLGQAEVPPGLSNVVAISAGWLHSLAITTNRAVAEWFMPKDK